MTVGEKIRKRRIELELTQEDLAKRLGYSTTSAVCRAETGKDRLTYARIYKFAKALDTTVEYLSADDESIKKDEEYAYAGLVEYRELYVDKAERIFEYAKRLSRLPDETRKAIELLIDNASK